jgi:hypothetical protein
MGAAAMLLGATLVPIHLARSADTPGLLETIHRHVTVATTIIDNGDLNGPWGNMATVDDGSTATLFISMAGFDVPGPEVQDLTGSPVTVNKAIVLRLQLSSPPGSGDLFGLAMIPGSKSFYYVEDDMNTLVEATP